MQPTEDSSLAQLGWTAELRRSHLLFGAGALERLGELVSDLGGGPVLLVTDPGIRAAGWAPRAGSVIADAGHEVAIFDGVEENPRETHVAAGAEVCQRVAARVIVGLGGGSAMDCAKGINFIATQGGCMEDYWGMGKAEKPMLKSIGVPCTAGTGSEAQSFALISRATDHVKMACGDEKARFDRVILDPSLVATAPRDVMATTAIDAVSHAVESMVSRAANPMSRMLAREAFRYLDARFDECVEAEEPASLAALGDMLLGAHLAGAAIEASMLGAAHALANPLTATFDVTHGAAVGLVLPAVVKFNAPVVGSHYSALLGGGIGAGLPSESAGVDLARRLERMRRLAGLPEYLDEVGVGPADLDDLARGAATQWTAGFNPREVGETELRSLYAECLKSGAEQSQPSRRSTARGVS